MATLKAHGGSIQVLEFTTRKESIQADGTILQNYGQGWKLKGKLKPGINPAEYAAAKLAKLQDKEARMPAYARFKKSLYDHASTIRYRLAQIVALMPGDPDGVWSEFDNFSYAGTITVDDAVELCRNYQAALAEARALKEAV